MPKVKATMHVFDLYWSPEGRRFQTVTATSARAAKRKAMKPYRKYLGEIYAVQISGDNGQVLSTPLHPESQP